MAHPPYHALVEKLAAKVITRVVKDGISLSNAITEAVKFAELDRQQTIHMCSLLQDYGMVYNGDHNNYFFMPEDMGKDFPNTPNGYVVYANKKNKNMDKVFDTIAQFKKAGLTDEEIVAFNPNIAPILEAVSQIESNYLGIVEDLRSGVSPEQAEMPQFSWQGEKEEVKPFTPFGAEQPIENLQMAASAKRGSFFKQAQEEAEVDTATPENLKKSLQDANKEAAPAEGGDADMGDLGDLGGDEDAPKEEGIDEDLGGLEGDAGGEEFEVSDESGVKATVRPSPSDLESEVSSAPKWEVDNILSIQVAENYYGSMRKKLDAVVFNENIMLDEESIKKYDAVRQKIDEQLEKIKDAQKETKKVEKKENELEQEFEVGGEEGGEEVGKEEKSPEEEIPTEELLVEGPEEKPTEEAMKE